MITDIERLHEVVEQRNKSIWKQRTGKTFSKCHDVAGMIELDLFEIVIVFITQYSDIDYIFPMLNVVFQDHELELIRVDRYTLRSNECIIKFFTDKDRYKTDCECGVVEMYHWN